MNVAVAVEVVVVAVGVDVGSRSARQVVAVVDVFVAFETAVESWRWEWMFY